MCCRENLNIGRAVSTNDAQHALFHSLRYIALVNCVPASNSGRDGAAYELQNRV